MRRKHTPNFAPVLLATAITLGLGIATAARSTAETTTETAAGLLEKGIYTEQTIGDLPAAIEIYNRIVESHEASRPHAAQAQLRLAMCSLKMGNDAEAREALEKLIREFPEQEQLVGQARDRLATTQPDLPLGAAPWKDGETLEYRMTLPTGKEIGSIFMKAESTVVDGVDAWQLELRRLVTVDADNYGVSRVLVDRQTQRPIRSSIRHGILGNATASYGPDGVEITGDKTNTFVDSHQEIYDNDQSMYLMRMLPLEPGYQVKIGFVPIWTAQLLETNLTVTGKELCEVPAGTFECTVAELDIGHSLWYSTGPEQYPIKAKGGGVVLELVQIGQVETWSPTAYGLDDFGFSGTLPDGWMVYEHRGSNRTRSAMVRFLDPNAEAISAVEVDRCPRGDCPLLQEMAERELEGAKRRFEAYTLRETSWTERRIDGRPAISFVGDYQRNGAPWVQYRIYTVTAEVRLEYIFRSPLEHFEGLRTTFDSIAESLQAH